MDKFTTCLWFDSEAELAYELYRGVFANTRKGKVAHYPKAAEGISGKMVGSVMTIEFELEDLKVLGLNGGPIFKHSPSFSFFVSCSSHDEIKTKWAKLSEGGTVRMGLDKYPWAESYGWTSDKYGIEWQLILQPRAQKIAPSFLFVDSNFGRGEEALNFYTSIFPNSKSDTIARDEKTNSVMHAAFTLNGQGFTLMEGQGKHGHKFSEAFSMMIHCNDQAEIDFFWSKLLAGGGEESQCGWLKDKFGVSWQVTSKSLERFMSDPNTSERAMKAMLTMKKIDIATIEKAVG